MAAQRIGNLAARARRPRLFAYLTSMVAVLLTAWGEGPWAGMTGLALGLGAFMGIAHAVLVRWGRERPALALHIVEAIALPPALLLAGAPAPILIAMGVGLVSANFAQGGVRLGVTALLLTAAGAGLGYAWFGAPQAGGEFAAAVAAGLLVCHGAAVGQLGFMQNARLAALRVRERGQARRLERIANVLGRYLSPQVRAELFESAPEAHAATRRRWVTVFFSDIAGFTRMTEMLEAEELSAHLNEYLDAMASIAIAHGGTIDKFIGDAVMVFFGDPHSAGRREDAIACLRMALAMRERLHALTADWQCRGTPLALRVRIGIASGYCTVGSFGCLQRMDYTIIGGAVNLASRLEGLAGEDQILLAPGTWALVRDVFACRRIGRWVPKGFPAAIEVFELLECERQEPIAVAVPGLSLIHI